MGSTEIRLSCISLNCFISVTLILVILLLFLFEELFVITFVIIAGIIIFPFSFGNTALNLHRLIQFFSISRSNFHNISRLQCRHIIDILLIELLYLQFLISILSVIANTPIQINFGCIFLIAINIVIMNTCLLSDMILA